jgi:hypothetical protein
MVNSVAVGLRVKLEGLPVKVTFWELVLVGPPPPDEEKSTVAVPVCTPALVVLTPTDIVVASVAPAAKPVIVPLLVTLPVSVLWSTVAFSFPAGELAVLLMDSGCVPVAPTRTVPISMVGPLLIVA